MWTCKHTWKRSSINTLWCLIGCSIGDLGTIIYFQNIDHSYSVLTVMGLAIIMGLITSIILETFILLKDFNFKNALKIALGMSLISMIGMEVAMNSVDFMLNGKAVVNVETLIPVLLAGFMAPLPYNYWRLKKFGIACH
ncbi:DUF4396 domain-containing protein [bacterium]|nr:DUF4396 domain-containing protein [bacterium]